MAWSDPVLPNFEDGDVLTQGNIQTYILDNLLALPHKLDYNVTALDVVSSTAETTFYTVTIPANTMGATGLVKMFAFGDVRGTDAGTHLLTVRVKFGGVTHYSYVNDYVNRSVRGAFAVEVGVANTTSTSAQSIWVLAVDRGLSASGTPGSTSPGAPSYCAPIAATVDTTVDQALLITVQWGTSASTNSVRRLIARTELGRN